MTRIEDMPPVRRTVARLARNVRWIREQGFAPVIEEHELNPVERVPAAYRRWRWRRAYGVAPGGAVPIYLVGAQRSGTNMLVRAFRRAPEFEIRSENDRAMFDRYKLRDDDVVRAAISASRSRYVILKPLCDSHRIDHLLDGLGTTQPGRGLWMYRDADGRVRSALAKFGDSNLQVLAEYAAGRRDRWQTQRLSPENDELVRSFDYASLSPASGAALFWYVRNSLWFDLDLGSRPDCRIVSYQRLMREPAAAMAEVCEFIGRPFEAALVDHIAPRPPAYREPLTLHPEIRRRCDELERRLDAVAAQPVH